MDTSEVPLGVVAVVAVLVVVVGAASAYFVFGGGEDTEPQPPLDSVPTGADAVVVVDGDVVTHDTTKKAMNSAIEQQQESSMQTTPVENYQDALDRVENETGLDPTAVNYVVAYGQYPDQQGRMATVGQAKGGMIVTSEWSSEQFKSALNETETEYTEETYGGATIYVDEAEYEYGQDTYVANLGDGTYALANNETAIHEIVDTHNGDAEAFSGPVRDSVSEPREDALVWFAADVPQTAVPERSPSQQIDVSQFRNVTLVSGSYYAPNGSTVGVTMTMHADTEKDATDVYDVVNGAVSLARGSVGNETVSSALDAVEVSQDGKTVTVSYEDSISDIAETGNAIANMGGGSEPEARAPQVALESEWDGNNVVITHDGGDTVMIDNLAFVNSAGEEYEVTTKAGDDSQLSAGDQVIVRGASPGDEVRVVWQSPEQGYTVTLFIDEVPGCPAASCDPSIRRYSPANPPVR